MSIFEISVNRETVCRVNLAKASARGVNLFWIGDETGTVILTVTGMEGDDHVEWSVPQLEIGDELTVRVLDERGGDPPATRVSAEKMDEWALGLKPRGSKKSENPDTNETAP